MKFTMNRDKVVRTLSGHSIEFKKGEPTHVPVSAYKDALAAGGEAQEDIPDDEEVAEKEPADPKKRRQLIVDSLTAMKTEGKRDDFTASGTPNLTALNTRLGFRIDAAERDDVWGEVVKG